MGKWSISSINDLINEVYDFRGRTPLKIGMEWGNGDIPALSANNVCMGKIDLTKPTNYGSIELYKKWMQGKEILISDILFTMEAPLGNVAMIEVIQLYILSQRTIVLRGNKQLINYKYLFHYLSSEKFQNHLLMYASGTTAKGIQRKQLFKLSIDYPEKLDEQEKIAEILSTVDIAIEKTKALIEKYKNIKEGLLQDLLANGIDENGNIRSPKTHEYKDSPIGKIPVEWECKRFDEVMPLQRGFDLPQSSISEGNYPVACSNGVIAYHSKYTTNSPCIWTGRSGTIGNVFYLEKNCWIHNTSLWVTNFKKNFPKYIYFLLSNFILIKF